jgi:NADPH:quinone reductase-like Zn-dependent oxidoreductase
MKRMEAEAQAALLALLAEGRYHPTAERIVGFADVPEALTDLAARRTTGRVVVQITEEV